MKDIWLISDTHFDHDNIRVYCNRPFENKEEMNECMIDYWNELIKPQDLVIHLGDFCWGDPEPFVKKLNGEIHLLLGNHDKRDNYHKLFAFVEHYEEIKPAKGVLICCQHFPLRSWNRSHYGSFHAYGHCHGTSSQYGRSMDVGVDTNNFYPYHIDDVMEQLKKFPVPNFEV